MSTAARAIASLPEREQPISEQFRIVARQWSDEDAAASLLEELKTTTLEKLKSKLMAGTEMAENRAERLAKSSPEWSEYIERMCGHRAKASRLKCQLEYIRMKFQEQQGQQANARHEARLGR
jgi:predicted nucleotidyltransferase